jgi:anti-sigma factor (TIGR02949 family)
MMDCRLVQKHLSAFVDAELEPTPMLEVEEHLVSCEACASTHDFMQALKREVRTRCAPGPAPLALRERVQAALADVQPVPATRERGQVWMTLAAIAASVLLVLGSVVGTDAPRVGRPVQASMAPIDVVRDVVDRHKDELPTEIQTEVPAQATSWFRDKLGFRVRSVEFAEPRVHFMGARVSQVGTHQAAKLYYSVGDSRLTVVMFKAPPMLAEALSSETEMARMGLHRTSVGGREVTYQTLQGYTVPIVHENGIVYAFAGDLDQSSLLRLVASARIPR